jgi:subfamily B ATP-binding cassette protein MsbA
MLIAFEGVSIGMLIPLFKVLLVEETTHIDFRFGSFALSVNIYMLLFAIFMIMLIKNIFAYLSGLCTVKLKSTITLDLRKRIFDKLMDMKIEFFNNESMGKINNAVVGEAQRAGLAAYSILKIILYSCISLFYVVWLFILNLHLSFICSGFLIIIFISSFYILKRSKKISSFISAGRSRLSSLVNESFYGIKIIKLFSREKQQENVFNNLVCENYMLDFRSGRLLEMTRPITQVFAAAGLVVLIIIGINIFRAEFRNQLPYMTAYFFIIFRLLPNIATINASRSQYLIQRNGFISVFDILNYEAQNRFVDGTITFLGLQEAIRFDRVWFRYPTNNNFQIQDLSFSIPKNRITAIVGPSGSGKTTLIDLISRLYDPTEGSILIDGNDLKHFKIASFRDSLGVVSQEVVLFNDTVRANILYSNPQASQDELQEAARLAHCDEFIRTLPRGYDTVIGERGAKLSGGHKQRISIARAFLKHPEIIILDEATSSLDSRSQQFIKDAVKKLMQNKTVIIIAHRLDTIDNADQVVLIHEGKIETIGSYQQMLNDERFASLLYPERKDATFVSNKLVT